MSGTSFSLPCLATAFALGAGVGFIHFLTLARVSDDYLAGRARRAIALQALRMVVMLAALVALARAGAGPLLAGALGVLVARACVIGRTRRLP